MIKCERSKAANSLKSTSNINIQKWYSDGFANQSKENNAPINGPIHLFQVERNWTELNQANCSAKRSIKYGKNIHTTMWCTKIMPIVHFHPANHIKHYTALKCSAKITETKKKKRRETHTHTKRQPWEWSWSKTKIKYVYCRYWLHSPFSLAVLNHSQLFALN